jgi:hypothetical protein
LASGRPLADAARRRDAAASVATVGFACGVAAGLLVWTHLQVRDCGGSDRHGYVSAAQALAAGSVVRPEPMVEWRPLVLALAPALLLLLPRQREAFPRFAAGAAPVFLATAGMQWLMDGSPLRTGYGNSAGLFTTANVGRRLGAFMRWTVAVQGAGMESAGVPGLSPSAWFGAP